MGKNPPSHHKFLNSAVAPKSTKRDKAQLAWEDRLISRREERESDALQATIARLENEMASFKFIEGRGQVKIESFKTRVAALDITLETAEGDLKDLASLHARTCADVRGRKDDLAAAKERTRAVQESISNPSGKKLSRVEDVKKLREELAGLNLKVEERAALEARVKVELGAVMETKKALVEEREQIEVGNRELVVKRDRLMHEIEAAKADGRASQASSVASSTAKSSPDAVSRLVETILKRDREATSLRAENMELLLQTVSMDA